MAEVWRHRRAIAAAFSALAAMISAPALAQDQGPKSGTDLYDRPVLAVDPGVHTAKIRSIAVDTGGRFAVTSSDDRTVRIWSIADGQLLRTIWIPVGPENVGRVFAVAMSPDGSTIAAGGFTQTRNSEHPIYILDRESGHLVRRIGDDLPDVTHFLSFSPDGRYLAATLGGRNGLRVFDQDKNWSEAFRDDQYGDDSYGAAFGGDDRLATTSWDGLIRSYRYDPNSNSPNFRRVGEPSKAPSGKRPRQLAYSPDSKLLAVGYYDVAAVDILDGTTLERVGGGHKPVDVEPDPSGTERIAWSRDGQTLFSAGGVADAQGRFPLFVWDHGGLGDEKRMAYCAPDTAAGIDALPDGRVLAAAMQTCLGLMNADGHLLWKSGSRNLTFRDQADALKVSGDGSLVDFGYRDPTSTDSHPVGELRFDLQSLKLSSPKPNDDLTFAPPREGLKVEGWRDGTSPTLNARPIRLASYEVARSVAIAPDRRFFLGSNFALTAFDAAGKRIWRWQSRNEVWAVNASKDRPIVVTADSDGAIRWHRANDGSELLTLQVLPNGKEPAKWDWVLWTPEGFYGATPGAEDVLKWVVNHGPDKAATTLPVSAIPKLDRRDALPHVLDRLETAYALGVDDISQARFEVQARTGSAKPPGKVLHVLAIGVDRFGDKAGGLHLDYAAEDARDVANALLESQKGSPSKVSLYADVSTIYLSNDKASKTVIEDTFGGIAQSMARNAPNQDVAVILVSSHGEMINGKFYLVPYDFVADGSKNAAADSAISASEFAGKVQALAKYGKVLLLLDACHSGAVGAQGWATDPDAKALQDAMDLENVTVLTSSKQNELSQELPGWQHGALAQAFLDALVGAADSKGIVGIYALAGAMDNEIQSLTKGQQHLGTHINFSDDLFVASHY